MYKIFLTVRNRLAMTRKCIKSIYVHAKLPFQLYVYDNSSNYLLEEHWNYFRDLYVSGKAAQITFTTKDSTFNAFSKAATCNFFGQQHEQDPNKDNYDFLLILDNDMLVTPGFDEILLRAWKDVKRHKLNHVKVISQNPGGIMARQDLGKKIAGFPTVVGKNGGSGFWSVQTNFFRDVGFLNLKNLVGQNKRHDILYWRLLGQSTGGKQYIIGLRTKLSYHCGRVACSVCNVLTKQPPSKRLDMIKFEKSEELINNMSFREFYKMVEEDHQVNKKW